VKDRLEWARISPAREQCNEKAETEPHGSVQGEGRPDAGRLHIGALMAKMGITPLYRKPNSGKRHPAHQIYPCWR